MRSRTLILHMTIAFGLCGCGYHFQNVTDANVPVPPYWANRDYVDPSIAGPLNTSIDWFAGRLLYKGADGQYHFLPPVFAGTPPALKVNTLQSSYSYQSAIDHNFSQKVTIPGLDFSPSTDVSYTYEITDVANVIVPDASVPTSTTVASTLKQYNVPSTTPVWWISVVELSTVREQQGSKIGTGDTVTGTGFSIDGTVMNTTSASFYVPLTSIVTIPMNAAAQEVAEAAPPPAPLPPPPRHVPPVPAAAPVPNGVTPREARLSGNLYQPSPQWTRHLEHGPSGLVRGIAAAPARPGRRRQHP